MFSDQYIDKEDNSKIKVHTFTAILYRKHCSKWPLSSTGRDFRLLDGRWVDAGRFEPDRRRRPRTIRLQHDPQHGRTGRAAEGLPARVWRSAGRPHQTLRHSDVLHLDGEGAGGHQGLRPVGGQARTAQAHHTTVWDAPASTAGCCVPTNFQVMHTSRV